MLLGSILDKKNLIGNFLMVIKGIYNWNKNRFKSNQID